MSAFVTNLSAHEYNRSKAKVVLGAVEVYIKEHLADIRSADLLVLKEFAASSTAYGFGTATTDVDKSITAFEPFGSDTPRPMTVAEVEALGYTFAEATVIVAREQAAYTRSEEPYGVNPRTDAATAPPPPASPPAPTPVGFRDIAVYVKERRSK